MAPSANHAAVASIADGKAGALDYFERRSEKVPMSGCWIWTGYVTKKGYGLLQLSAYRTRFAHRAVFEAAYGPIPDGLHALHRCDVPSCVNPNHLFLGTNDDNMADKAKKDRSARFYGTKNPRGKLSDDQVLQIRGSNRKTAVLAREFGLSYSAIYSIKNNRTHRNLPCHA